MQAVVEPNLLRTSAVVQVFGVIDAQVYGFDGIEIDGKSFVREVHLLTVELNVTGVDQSVQYHVTTLQDLHLPFRRIDVDLSRGTKNQSLNAIHVECPARQAPLGIVSSPRVGSELNDVMVAFARNISNVAKRFIGKAGEAFIHIVIDVTGVGQIHQSHPRLNFTQLDVLGVIQRGEHAQASGLVKPIQLNNRVDGVDALKLIEAGLLKIVEALEHTGFRVVDQGIAYFDLRMAYFPRKALDVPLQGVVAVLKRLLPHAFQLSRHRNHLTVRIKSHRAIGMPHGVAFEVQFKIRVRRCHATIGE